MNNGAIKAGMNTVTTLLIIRKIFSRVLFLVSQKETRLQTEIFPHCASLWRFEALRISDIRISKNRVMPRTISNRKSC